MSGAGRVPRAKGQRVGLFKGWEAGVLGSGAYPGPWQCPHPSWKELCMVVHAWEGVDQKDRTLRFWGHRHPRLGLHRCWTGSVSHLEWAFLPGWFRGEPRWGQQGWDARAGSQRWAGQVLRARWHWVSRVGGSMGGVGRWAAAAVPRRSSFLLGWLRLLEESLWFCPTLRWKWQLGLAKDHTLVPRNYLEKGISLYLTFNRTRAWSLSLSHRCAELSHHHHRPFVAPLDFLSSIWTFSAITPASNLWSHTRVVSHMKLRLTLYPGIYFL